jgi:DNA-binding MarR family transcriptional regulator
MMNNQKLDHLQVDLQVDPQETAERNIGFLINDTARQLRTNYDRRMRDLGLTRSQWWVLNHLYFNEGLSQTNLSDIMEIERATLGRLLDRLETKGWIERRTVPKDRRVKLVFLARAVEPLLRTMRSLAADLRAEALADLTDQEQEQFIATLIKVKGNLLAMGENGYGDGGNGNRSGTRDRKNG